MSTIAVTVNIPRSPALSSLAIIAGHVDDIYAANLRKNADLSHRTGTANTERALLSDVLLFNAWCAGAGLQHMPASAETVAAFIDAQSAIGKAPSSIRRYTTSIASCHRAAEAPNPLELKIATDALKRMARVRGDMARVRGETPHQTKAINDNLLVRMLQSAGNRRVDLRNKALLTLAYTTMCRRSELVGLLTEDLNVDADGSGSIIVRKSKIGQIDECVSVAIPSDAMHHLRAWLATSGESGPLFRSVNQHGQVGGPLYQGSVASIFKAMANLVRPRLRSDEVAQISAHSTRIGACQDMVRYGAEIADAMQAGRWQTMEMVLRYCEGLEWKRDAAQVATRREQFI